jgi:heme-degrading monooxygenase HmoA
MIAAVTRIKLKSILKLPKFIFVANPIFKQAKNAPGNSGVKSTKKGLEFFTLTIWDDERSMMDFMLAGAHKEAMKNIRSYSVDYGSAHWTVSEMPPWDEALAKLKTKT